MHWLASLDNPFLRYWIGGTNTHVPRKVKHRSAILEMGLWMASGGGGGAVARGLCAAYFKLQRRRPLLLAAPTSLSN